MTNSNNEKISTPVAIIIAAIIVGIGLYFGLSSSPTAPVVVKEKTTKEISRAIKIKPNNSQDLETKVTADEHLVGNFDKAEVFVIEYSDLECPFCKRFNDTEKTSAYEQFKNDDRVAFVFRQFPLGKPLTGRDLHPTTPEEAVIAECVAILGGEEKFEKFKDTIFSETSSDGDYDLPYLLTQAEELGIRKDELEKCYSGSEAAAKVAKQFQQGVLMGVQGTPTVIIQTKDGKTSLLDRSKGETLVEKIKSYLK